MPRYYFHFRQGDTIAEDGEGVDLPELDGAKATALNSLRELISPD